MFVLQRHTGIPEPHFDLMVEDGEALATWSLSIPPEGPGPFPARKIKDHRKAYLTFEGEIGEGKGAVRIWDRGASQVRSKGEDAWEIALEGDRLRGGFALVRKGEAWELRRKDAARGSNDE